MKVVNNVINNVINNINITNNIMKYQVIHRISHNKKAEDVMKVRGSWVREKEFMN